MKPLIGQMTPRCFFGTFLLAQKARLFFLLPKAYNATQDMRKNQPMVSCTPLFFADAMLGKLARWLRMLGYDTAYQRDITDSDLVSWGLREDRWLLMHASLPDLAVCRAPQKNGKNDPGDSDAIEAPRDSPPWPLI